MEYSYVEDVQYIQEWRPELIENSMDQNVEYTRYDTMTNYHRGRCGDVFTSKSRKVNIINSPVLRES